MNFYNLIPSNTRNTIPYTSYPKIRIELPTRCLIVGPSGAMKTNTMLNIITSINAFSRIILCAKNLDEELYKLLTDTIRKVEKRMKVDILTCIDNIEDIPPVEDFDPLMNNVIIIDDMITEDKKLLEGNVASLYVRGRRANISLFFISQSFFKIPLLIRQNTDLIVIKNIRGKKDLTRIISEYSLDKTMDEILILYQKACSGSPINWFMIDLKTTDPTLKFRKNFEAIV